MRVKVWLFLQGLGAFGWCRELDESLRSLISEYDAQKKARDKGGL